LADELRTGRSSLSRLLKETLLVDAAHPLALVILIDQFEEYFLSQPVDPLRQHFLNLLAETAAESFLPHRVALVIALRADFLGQALAHGSFANAVQESVFALGALTRAEMARAVELPAQMQHVYFEPGMVDRLLDDVGDQAGRLPLLQFCLTYLWQEQRDGWIGHAAYLEIEGLSGALNHYANGVLARLHPDQQMLARRVLLRLVHVQEDVEPSRRLGLRSEFSRAEWAVVQVLSNARLLVTDRTTAGVESVELVHEALIRNWERLARWLHDDRAYFFWREGLRAGLGLWEKTGRDSGALLRGGLLAEAEARTTDRWGELSPAENDFVAASLALRRQELEEEARERQQEKEQAEALAMALESRTQALREAQRATALAQSHAMVSAAQLALYRRDTDKALQLALDALDPEDPTPESQLMLADAAYAPGTIRRFLGHHGPIHGVAYYPDGRRIVAATAGGVLIVWNLDDGVQRLLLVGHTDAVHAVQVSPDGRSLLSASADGSLILWDAENGGVLRRWQGHRGAVRSIAIHPDGEMALSAGADNQVILWEMETGRAIAHWQGHQQPVFTVVISPDGTRALSGDAQGTVIHWELAGGRKLHVFAGYLRRGQGSDPEEGHYDAVWGLAFRADGRSALSVSQDQCAILWDLAEGTMLWRNDVFKAGLFAVSLCPDGRSALLGGLDSRMATLDLASGECRHFLGHTGRLHAIVASPDGRYALTGSADGTARYWDLRHGAEVRVLNDWGRHRVAASLDISPDGKTGATAAFDGTILLWDVPSGTHIRSLAGHTEMAYAGVKFLPDNQHLLSASGSIFAPLDDFSLRLWHLKTGAEVHRFLGHTDKIWDMALSPDGSFAVSASHDGTLRRWDLQSRESRILANIDPQVVISTAISPDGLSVLMGVGKGESNHPDYSLRMVDSRSGQERRRFFGHTESVQDVAFSPDGRLALSGRQDRRLILWDVTTGSQVAHLADTGDVALRLAFSPDGALACQGSLNGMILLWDVEKRTPIRRLIGSQRAVLQVLFSADGRRLYSADDDGAVREWRVDRTLAALQAWRRQNRSADELP
jgi:WD40 repeat protein